MGRSLPARNRPSPERSGSRHPTGPSMHLGWTDLRARPAALHQARIGPPLGPPDRAERFPLGARPGHLAPPGVASLGG